MEDIKKNMYEKHGWMRRTYSRMRDCEDDPVSVQDHFWTFIHAAQLIWYYFGRACKSATLPSERLINEWKERCLQKDEQKAWDTINSLRNEDVHIKPVKTKKESEPDNVVVGGQQVVTSAGESVVVGTWQYSVNSSEGEWDIWQLCETVLSVKEKFIDQFTDLIEEELKCK